MDPNETLARIRVLTSDARLSYAGSKWAEQYGEELAELIKSLDDWMSKGGFKPNAWEGPFAEEPVQPDFRIDASKQDEYGFPHWSFYDAEGSDISSSIYAEIDATEARLWDSPTADGPAEVWERDASEADSPWIRQDV